MKAPLKLKPEHLELVCEVLAKHLDRQEVWAYGSRVTGEAHGGSDLDLVVHGTKRLGARKLAELRAAFRESNLPMEVHIFDWVGLPKSFHGEMERTHVVIHPPQATGS